MIAQPLAGRRVVVTRTRQQAGSLSAALRALGAEVIELPTIEIVPPESYEPLDRALRSINMYQWMVVTSANTVRVLSERLEVLGLNVSSLRAVKVAAIGASTGEALVALGTPPDLVPERYVAESLVEALRDKVSGRALLVRASVGRDTIPDELTALGVTVDVVDAYRTVAPTGVVGSFRGLFGSGQTLPDAVTFTSSSTVKHFFGLLRDAGMGPPPGVAAVSIGPVTSATLREYGWEPSAEAAPHDVDGLVEATGRALAASRA